jgi:Holliday junction resolvasome RuvABC ATP-dependent DNA helicase subunit
VQEITGQVSLPPIAIVASTLAIAALFQPLRKRIQAIIDRRFYRRKYDAARILEAFSTSLRHEVDLNQLNEQLVEIVQETMQPTHVSLWLRSRSRDEMHNTQV